MRFAPLTSILLFFTTSPTPHCSVRLRRPCWRRRPETLGTSFRVLGTGDGVFGTSFEVSGTSFQVFGAGDGISGTSFRVFGTSFEVFGASAGGLVPALDPWERVTRPREPVPKPWELVTEPPERVPRPWALVTESWTRVTEFRERVPGSWELVSKTREMARERDSVCGYHSETRWKYPGQGRNTLPRRTGIPADFLPQGGYVI
uniref:Uncharacterized protein n=1 Tax=Candidatus Kentrum sp. DK TaxID=2126562 RepID=A0A450T3T0_9GAMM|nr:MAG: hypothetical protein BECKDK2373C_GA0170839_10879 [Candidatus Kentron sp. DK]